MSPYPAPGPPDASTARLSAQVESIGREIRELRRTAEATLAQARTTNGRVDGHDIDLARIATREEERTHAAEVLAEALAKRDRQAEESRARRDRWLLGMATVTAGGVLTTLMTIALRLWG